MNLKTVVIGLLLVLSSTQSNAQESDMNDNESNDQQTPATPEQLELQEAQLRRDLAEAQLKEAEFKLSLEKLGDPTGTSTGNEGTIEIDTGAGYYSEILSFDALNAVSDKISNEVLNENTSTSKIVVSTNFEFSEKYQLWNMLNKQLDYLDSSVVELLDINPASVSTESVGSVLALTTGTLAAITDISKFFKTNRKLSKVEFELSTNALNAAIVNSLKTKAPNSQIYLEAINFSTGNILTNKVDKILQNMAKVPAHKLDVYASFAEFIIRIKQTEEKIKELEERFKKESDQAKKDQIRKEINQLQLDNENNKIEVKKWEIISAQFETTTKLVEKSVDVLYGRQNGQPSLLEMVSEIELIESLKEPKNNPQSPYVLLVEISSQGGEVEISKGSLFRKSKVTYLGGIVISYILITPESVIEKSGVVSSFKTKKYKSISEISDESSSRNKVKKQ